MNTSRTKYFKK